MPIPTKTPMLVDEPEPQQPETHALTRRDEAPGGELVLMFERLAKDPAVDVEKLERLIAMQERIMRHNAKAEFDGAFAEMQGELPEIGEKGQIIVEGRVRSTYATNEDIQRAIKPILQKHGFSLRFRNEWTDGKLRIVGILSHRSGHSEQDEFIAGADTSGSKNAIQALGSTRAYGQRYTTLALLNIATRGEDDDGSTSEKHKAPEAPKGYDDWLADMEATADGGLPALESAWKQSRADFRAYTAKHNGAKWAALKNKANKAVTS